MKNRTKINIYSQGCGVLDVYNIEDNAVVQPTRLYEVMNQPKTTE